MQRAGWNSHATPQRGYNSKTSSYATPQQSATPKHKCQGFDQLRQIRGTAVKITETTDATSATLRFAGQQDATDTKVTTTTEEEPQPQHQRSLCNYAYHQQARRRADAQLESHQADRDYEQDRQAVSTVFLRLRLCGLPTPGI